MEAAMPGSQYKPNEYGLVSAMTYGFQAEAKIENAGLRHPVEKIMLEFDTCQQHIQLMTARRLQGIHAPLRLEMERRAAMKVGRLPFLESSNFMLDVLTGRDELIEHADFLGLPEFKEVAGQPHAVMERKLKLL